MKLPEFDKPFEVHTEANDFIISKMLMHDGQKCMMHDAYDSKNVAILASTFNYVGHFSNLAKVTSVNPLHFFMLMVNFLYYGPLSS